MVYFCMEQNWSLPNQSTFNIKHLFLNFPNTIYEPTLEISVHFNYNMKTTQQH